MSILSLTGDDREWMREFIRDRWHASFVVAHGRSFRPDELPGFRALIEERPAGLVTYEIRAGSCEIVTLDSLVEDQGVGTALIRAVTAAAREAGCRRLWLITTNDNLRALGFYQKRGFGLVAVHRNALDRSREIKPQIGLIGLHGIPLRDEIELEYLGH